MKMVNLATGQIEETPPTLNGADMPSRETLLANGRRDIPVAPPVQDGYERGPVTYIEGDGITAQAVYVDRLKTEIEEEAGAAREQAESERMARLINAFAGAVVAVRTELVRLGYDLPCDAPAVRAGLTARAVSRQLTYDQQEAKNNLATLYSVLMASGVGDAEIAAIWEAVKS